MAAICYYGNVMATTRWRLCVTMTTLWQQQDGGYALLFYIFNSTVIDWTFDVEYIYGFVRWGVCRQSRWSHSVTVPHTRWRICVTMTTLWQQQDGGYMLLWKRYGNNKMAAMRYYDNVMTTTRWRLYVTMETLWQQQDGGYALLWKRYSTSSTVQS